MSQAVNVRVTPAICQFACECRRLSVCVSLLQYVDLLANLARSQFTCHVRKRALHSLGWGNVDVFVDAGRYRIIVPAETFRAMFSNVVGFPLPIEPLSPRPRIPWMAFEIDVMLMIR